MCCRHRSPLSGRPGPGTASRPTRAAPHAASTERWRPVVPALGTWTILSTPFPVPSFQMWRSSDSKCVQLRQWYKVPFKIIKQTNTQTRKATACPRFCIVRARKGGPAVDGHVPPASGGSSAAPGRPGSRRPWPWRSHTRRPLCQAPSRAEGLPATARSDYRPRVAEPAPPPGLVTRSMPSPSSNTARCGV